MCAAAAAQGLPRKDFKAITLDNLRAVAEELGEEITEAELKEMLEFLDAKGAGNTPCPSQNTRVQEAPRSNIGTEAQLRGQSGRQQGAGPKVTRSTG